MSERKTGLPSEGFSEELLLNFGIEEGREGAPKGNILFFPQEKFPLFPLENISPCRTKIVLPTMPENVFPHLWKVSSPQRSNVFPWNISPSHETFLLERNNSWSWLKTKIFPVYSTNNTMWFKSFCFCFLFFLAVYGILKTRWKNRISGKDKSHGKCPKSRFRGLEISQFFGEGPPEPPLNAWSSPIHRRGHPYFPLSPQSWRKMLMASQPLFIRLSNINRRTQSTNFIVNLKRVFSIFISGWC